MLGHRRQWIALVLSGIFPGLGQFYLRAWGKGAAFLAAGVATTWVFLQLVSVEDLRVGFVPNPGLLLAALLALLVAFTWSVVDAWISGR
jgi:TM2 domain-containing membrane protein YozV